MVSVMESCDLDAVVTHLWALRRGAIKRAARELGLVPPVEAGPRYEARRLAAIKGRAGPPAQCGPEIQASPARGALRPVQTVAVRPTAEGYDVQHVGFQGRSAARASDVFDVMCDQARRRGGAAPLTGAQIDTARRYAALVERHSAVGLKCVSIETQGARSSGGGGGYMDAVLAEGEVIARMAAAVGDGVAVSVHRADGRVVCLSARALVDAVCLEGRAVSSVLRGAGITVYGGVRVRAFEALGAALDRMARAAPGW